MKCEIIKLETDFNTKELDELRDILKGNPYRSKSLKDYNYIVIMIACHGNENDEILDNNDDPFKLINLYNASSGNKDLEKIPKIFILNHCRGNNEIYNNND